MDLPESTGTRLFRFAFRALCYGMLVLGVIGAGVGAVMIASAVTANPMPSSDSGIVSGIVFLLGGIAFALAGLRGSRVRTRRDFDAELPPIATYRDRLERWINR